MNAIFRNVRHAFRVLRRAPGFSLTAKHAKAPCRACHRGNKPWEFERLDKTQKGKRCMSCHRHANVHNGQHTDIAEVSQRPLQPDGKTPKMYCLQGKEGGCHKQPGEVSVDRIACCASRCQRGWIVV